MGANGEKNTKFGVYKNLCCGLEIVLSEGVTFPDCPNHPRLPTIWKSISDPLDAIPHASQLRKKKDNSAA
jgi:hypothetical protein